MIRKSESDPDRVINCCCNHIDFFEDIARDVTVSEMIMTMSRMIIFALTTLQDDAVEVILRTAAAHG